MKILVLLLALSSINLFAQESGGSDDSAAHVVTDAKISQSREALKTAVNKPDDGRNRSFDIYRLCSSATRDQVLGSLNCKVTFAPSSIARCAARKFSTKDCGENSYILVAPSGSCFQENSLVRLLSTESIAKLRAKGGPCHQARVH